jgi:uncharacterized protein
MRDEIDHRALESWLLAYGRAWETGDPDAAVALFASDAAYYEVPFDEPMVGSEAIRRYWSEGAGQTQKDVRFEFRILSTAGRTGIAKWQASFERVPSGVKVGLDGILTAELDQSGRCRVFREWWHRVESGATAHPSMALDLEVLPGLLAVCRLPADSPDPAWLAGAALTSVTRSAGETSIVCDAGVVPPGVTAVAGWRAIKVVGPLDLALTGVLLSVAQPLAQAAVPIFVLSTFDTDYVLVKEDLLAEAIAALSSAGHRVE